MDNETKEELELSNFLHEFQDVFLDDNPRNLPPKRGIDDHSIDLSQLVHLLISCLIEPHELYKRKVMRQVNKLGKGMV